VLDVGSGSGVLAIFAAQAGAKKVRVLSCACNHRRTSDLLCPPVNTACVCIVSGYAEFIFVRRGLVTFSTLAMPSPH
ncbi:unnamed protein product, partial [Sphacelaria rigidula]